MAEKTTDLKETVKPLDMEILKAEMMKELREEIKAELKAEMKARAKEEEIKVEKPSSKDDFLEEMVTVTFMKDNERYKEDIIVGINGYNYRIKRGVPVTIPRFVFGVISDSDRQSMVASNLSQSLADDFVNESKRRGL